MSVDPSTLATFSGKQVILHLIQDDGSVAELEGKVEDASEVGMAFKEKGKRDVDLVLPDQIEEITAAPEKPKKIVQKKLKAVTVTTVRQHLADRHGWTIGEVNEMSDDEALGVHDDLDHSDLGHKHESDEDDNNEAGENESAA